MDKNGWQAAFRATRSSSSVQATPPPTEDLHQCLWCSCHLFSSRLRHSSRILWTSEIWPLRNPRDRAMDTGFSQNLAYQTGTLSTSCARRHEPNVPRKSSPPDAASGSSAESGRMTAPDADTPRAGRQQRDLAACLETAFAPKESEAARAICPTPFDIQKPIPRWMESASGNP
jgi:hypothetical protein